MGRNEDEHSEHPRNYEDREDRSDIFGCRIRVSRESKYSQQRIDGNQSKYTAEYVKNHAQYSRSGNLSSSLEPERSLHESDELHVGDEKELIHNVSLSV